MTEYALDRFVFEVAFALQRLRVYVLAQNVLVELRVGEKKVSKPRFDSLLVSQHVLGDVIGVDVDANRANDSKFLSFDWDRRAFEFSRANVQLVIQFFFVKKLAAFEVDEQVRCAVAQMPSGNIIF